MEDIMGMIKLCKKMLILLKCQFYIHRGTASLDGYYTAGRAYVGCKLVE